MIIEAADLNFPMYFNWREKARRALALWRRSCLCFPLLLVLACAGGTARAASWPYDASPLSVPGTIPTAQYDNGGEGVAYHDRDAANLLSNSYRPGLGVDSSGSGVGWISAGEWLAYTVNVSVAGDYTLALSLSHPGTGGAMHVDFNGVNATGVVPFPTTGGWGVFQTITKTVRLNAGRQVMHVVFDANGSTGYGPGLGNIVISTAIAQSPFGGAALMIPGTINPAHYDNGGEGVAYHDNEAANLMTSGAFRTGVDARANEVGWISAGEWLEYTINVSASGAYTLSIPLSHPGTGGTMHVTVDGVNVTGPLGIPSTASWDTYSTITKSVALSAGIQVLRVDFDTNGSTGYGPGLRGIAIVRAFSVYDSTLYANKPNLSGYGIQPIPIAYAGTFGSGWYNDPARLPDQQAVRDVARAMSATTKRVVLDIEHWPLTGSAADVSANIAKYKTVAQWFKEAAPGCEVGYYGAPPVRDYWRAIRGPADPGRMAWQAENDRLAPLAQSVDILFPSLYTFYSDQPGWVAYAKAQIAEARRYQPGKPVYVFLWPGYHDSNATLRGTYLPADYWRLELNTALQYADGVVLWGGWNNGREQWDEMAPWWQVTKEFMRSLGGTAPLNSAAPTSNG